MATASTPPAAPSRWPVIDFVELTASRRAWSPKTVLMARVSVVSLSSVDVPWALTYWTSSGPIPASSMARCMTRAAPSPVGSGAAT